MIKKLLMVVGALTVGSSLVAVIARRVNSED